MAAPLKNGEEYTSAYPWTPGTTGFDPKQKEVSKRIDKSNKWFNRLFLIMAFVILVLALAPLAYPNGLDLPGGTRQEPLIITIAMPTSMPISTPTITPVSPTPTQTSVPARSLK